MCGKQGWLRVNKSKEPAQRKVRETGKRDNKPELELLDVDKLKRRFDSQLHARSWPRVTKRRTTLAERAQRFITSRSKRQPKEKRAGAVVRTIRKDAQLGAIARVAIQWYSFWFPLEQM